MLSTGESYNQPHIQINTLIFTCDVIARGPVLTRAFLLAIPSVRSRRAWGVAVDTRPAGGAVAAASGGVTSDLKSGIRNMLKLFLYFHPL